MSIKRVVDTDRFYVHTVGAEGFEPSTSRTRTVRASRAALRPERSNYTVMVKGTSAQFVLGDKISRQIDIFSQE